MSFGEVPHTLSERVKSRFRGWSLRLLCTHKVSLVLRLYEKRAKVFSRPWSHGQALSTRQSSVLGEV